MERPTVALEAFKGTCEINVCPRGAALAHALRGRALYLRVLARRTADTRRRRRGPKRRRVRAVRARFALVRKQKIAVVRVLPSDACLADGGADDGRDGARRALHAGGRARLRLCVAQCAVEAVVRAHAEPNTVGTQAIAVTECHQSASAHIHIPTFTTT